MKHVLAILGITVSFAVAAPGWAQVQQGAPLPLVLPADAPGTAARRIRSFPLCGQRTRCDALRTSALRGRAIA